MAALAGLAGAFTPTAAGATTLTASSRLSELGVGPVKVDMTVAQAEAAAGRSLDLSFAAGTGECGQGSFVGGPRNVSVLVTDGRIRRVEAYKAYGADGPTRSRIRTSRGIRIGSRERTVLRRYPGARRERHEYVRDGEYLIVRSRRKPKLELVFETDERNRVTAFRGGRRPEVEYVEGCA